MTMSKQWQDREKESFKENPIDQGTDKRVTIQNAEGIGGGIIAGIRFDKIEGSYPNDTTEQYIYSLSTATVATVTVVYTDSSKVDVLTVTKT